MGKAPITSNPTCDQYVDKVKKPSKDGGWLAEEKLRFEGGFDEIEENFHEIVKEFEGDTFELKIDKSALEVHAEVHEDFQQMRYLVRGQNNNKTIPPWGLPMEVWKILMNPDHCIMKPK